MQRPGPVATAADATTHEELQGHEIEVEDGGESLQLSALFTAMMESNAMLREEIDIMEGRKEASCSSPELVADSDDHHSGRGSNTGSHSGQLHSRSLPAGPPESSRQPPVNLTTTWNPSSESSQLGANKTDQSVVHTVSLGNKSSDSDTEATESQGTDVEEESLPPDPQVLGQPPHRPIISRPLLSRLPLSITSISSTDESESDSNASPEPENDPFASPGESAIETMWDNFSVEEYAPPLKNKTESKVGNKKPVAKKTVVLRPRVTVPEPFAMTIRDEGRPKMRKSRALLVAEREKLQKEMQEELECQKKFRALPVPATTYVPADEIRRQGWDEQDCEKVAEPIKPFRFMKREEEKQLQKQRQMDEMRNNKDTVSFRAKPAPQSILSPRVSEELKEREEYRRILIKVRSQEMLAQAALPKNMQEKQKRDSLKKQRLEEMQNRASVTEEHTFRPKIWTQVPNHNQLYCQFQEKMAAKKEVRPATTPRPFLFRTASTPSRCLHPHDEEHHHSTSFAHHTTAKSRTCTPQVRCSRTGSEHCPREPTIVLTEAAKLRRVASERKLAECAEREVEGEEKRRVRKEKARELQSRVIQRVQSQDCSAWLEERQRERLQELRSVACNGLAAKERG